MHNRFIDRFSNRKVNLKTSCISYYNFWTTQKAKDIWFSKFIEHYQLLDRYRGKVNFYSVLGSIERLNKRKKGVNIFYSGENLNAERFSDYRAVCAEKPFDLSLGFEYLDTEHYMRLPLWLITLFDPTVDYKGVKNRVAQLNSVKEDGRTGFCSLVASHDWNGIRGQIMNALSEIDTISSGGKFRNNTNALNTLYANNKYDFIRQYKFNICPENSNASGYVTEKVFQAIEAGCIPIYWGADNYSEPDILNQEAIIFWKNNGDNKNAISLIKQLNVNKKIYTDFVHQPRLKDGTADVIWSYYLRLKQNFESLFI
jgi:alpha(1,3/1,4) fucosyltransferase